MFANEALEEIKQWRTSAVSPQHQLDWRWVERFRALASYDSHWWLAPAGPLTEEEEQQWAKLFVCEKDEATKEQLGRLMKESRMREVRAAMMELREPRLQYPAIDIEDVRRRISDLCQLDGEIAQNEPNVLVRRFYQGAIEEEINFLRLIEATYEGNTSHFKEYTQRLNPPPTKEEISYALSRVRLLLLKGLQQPETVAEVERVIQVLREQCGLALDLSCTEQDMQVLRELFPPSSPDEQESRTVSAQAAKRFFEAALQESGFDGWNVVIDSSATNTRVEQGLRSMFLPDHSLSVDHIKHLLCARIGGTYCPWYSRRTFIAWSARD